MTRLPSFQSRLLGAFVLAAGALLSACGGERTELRLATTTSLDNSGLLDTLRPIFTIETGIDVRVLAVGTGKAIQLLRRSDVDLAFTHDPEAEAALMAHGHVTFYRKIMFNDFLIVGPGSDPARIGKAPGVAVAMRRLAASSSLFAARGDASGTYARELALWKLAGTRPPPDGLLETGQGMGTTLRIASERRAYCLTDRATYAQLAPTLRLEPLFEGGRELLNTYAVILAPLASANRARDARRLADWLSQGNGRRAIEHFTIRGTRAFTVWPADRPREDASALPM